MVMLSLVVLPLSREPTNWEEFEASVLRLAQAFNHFNASASEATTALYAFAKLLPDIPDIPDARNYD